MNRDLAFKIGLGIAVAVGVAATLFFSFITVLTCEDGDGGAPYVAVDSDQEAFCSATGNGLGLLVVALLGIAVLAWVAWRRWKLVATGGAVVLPVALLVATAAVPVPVAAAYNFPSDNCSDAEQASYDEWLYSKGRIDTPYECETY